AIALDPSFASAYGMAARCYSQRKACGWIEDRARDIAEAREMARQAATLGREDAVALCASGVATAFVVGDPEAGSEMINRALALNPNLAMAWVFSSWTSIWLGKAERAIDDAKHALRLSPHDPQIFNMQAGVAAGHFLAGRYGEAAEWAEVAMRDQPKFGVATALLAARLALAGKQTPAQVAMAAPRPAGPGPQPSKFGDRF